MSIQDEGNHLALTLAVNAIMTLHDAGLLSDKARLLCARQMQAYAERSDAVADEAGAIPPEPAVQIGVLARLLSQDRGRLG